MNRKKFAKVDDKRDFFLNQPKTVSNEKIFLVNGKKCSAKLKINIKQNKSI